MNPDDFTPPTSRHHQKIRAHPQNRAAFLARAGIGLLGAAFMSGKSAAAAAPVSGPGSLPRWKGKKESKVKQWAVITIGNLSRNRYWGESDGKSMRAAICTCTLIQGDGFRVLVDPSLSNADEMTRELDRRAGLKPGNINLVFITHEHGDHYAGLKHFSEARWCASPEVAALLRSQKLGKEIEPVTNPLFGAIDIVPTPGHTMSHCSLRFDCDGLSVVVTGDAVATRNFWRERRGYYNCVNFELSARSMEKIAGLADVIVPGHDNYFLNL